MASDTWDPDRYGRFAAEWRQPFLDLLSLLHQMPEGRAVDLGCGTGELTRALHERMGLSAHEIHYRITASHFLWKMVRRLAGTLVEVGRGSLDATAVADGR